MMQRVLVISLSAAVGTFFFYWFSVNIKKKYLQDFVHSHLWLLHPNAICYWRAAFAVAAFFMYFFSSFQVPAIVIFTLAAIMDGVDGVVARNCNLGTPWGEWLDPMCDKLTYLPPLIGFGLKGIISIDFIWILLAIELSGQFLARHILTMFKISGAANNFGKIKAIICFTLVILCALLDKNPQLINIGDPILLACIFLALASIVFKFVPNRLYADILSTLNFTCGIASLVLTYNQRFAWAICVIIIGQLFDLFDGRMAEKHGGTKYGPILDDVADFTSFGIAPAYVVYQSGGSIALIFGLFFIAGVAFRLVRFVAVDKKRTDLPEGIFNGLPSPAGALIVLGAALVFPPPVLWGCAVFSVLIMISHVRFAHFGRIIIKRIPRPLFYGTSAALIVILAFILKTKNAEMFGYLILGSVFCYMVVGWKWQHWLTNNRSG